MKIINKLIVLSVTSLLFVTSCTDYLDINQNPNSAISVSPDLVLPQAIVTTASVSVTFNNYGAHFGGYVANAGGYSGFGNLLNYNLTPNDYGSLWSSTFSNLKDYNDVLQNTEGNGQLSYINAAAKIMMILSYQRLVDAYGNIPYSNSLLGLENLAPAYDEAETVYRDLIDRIDLVIGEIVAALAVPETDVANFPVAMNSSVDPLFTGDMELWKRFANTIKLRMLIRLSSKSDFASYVTEKFASFNTTLGVLESDAIVNPGYERTRANPTWSSWGYSSTGNVAQASRIPTRFSYGFYDGNKIEDYYRGVATYNNFPSTPINQLGNEDGAPPIRTNYPPYYTGTRASASSISDALGVLKGPSQGQPVLLAAESSFLLAEAYLFNYLSGDYQAAFETGVNRSFQYLYKNVSNALSVSTGIINGYVSEYKADNEGNYLVNIEDASTDAERQEAIITQKYIALNLVGCDEAWNEYRRTGFPRTVPGGAAYANMASSMSNSPRPDRLPTRIMYPQDEYSYNPTNVIVINPFVDLMFWVPAN